MTARHEYNNNILCDNGARHVDIQNNQPKQ